MDSTDTSPPEGRGPWTLWARKALGMSLACHGIFSDYDRASAASDDLVLMQGYSEAVVKDAMLETAYTHQGKKS